MHKTLFAILLTIPFLVLGCQTGDDDDDTSSTVCEAGATQHCFCAGGAEGAQVCEEDGSAWGACDCGSGDDDDTTGDDDDTTAGDDDTTGDDDDTTGDDDDSGDDDTDPCTPPDTWTGPIDPALYTTVPWTPAYDAGLDEVESILPVGSCSSSVGDGYLVYDATIVAVGDHDGSWNPRVFVADANYTIMVIEAGDGHVIGDRVGFAVSWVGARSDGAWVEHPDGWTVLSNGNSVSVRDLGSDNLDYYAARNEMLHVYGEITEQSAYDCDYAWGLTCYMLEHDGTEDRIRVEVSNPWGIDVDYEGGLCAEIVAPIGHHNGDHGPVTFLDVMNSDWMRVWAK